MQEAYALGEAELFPYIRNADVYWRPNGSANKKELLTPPAKPHPRPAKSMEVERIKAEIASLIDTLPANPSPEAKSTFDVNLNRLVLDMYKAKGVDPHTGEKI